MAILNALIPSASGDIVSIIEADTGNQVFQGARPMKVTVSESARLLAHPIESGGSVVDHRIILPISLSVSMILESRTYRATYQEIRQLFRDSIRLSVQTKTDTYFNLYLQDIPHEEDPALFDTITIVLQFIETRIATVQVVALSPAAVLSANDSSTVDRGQQTGTDAGSNESLAIGLLRRFRGNDGSSN